VSLPLVHTTATTGEKVGWLHSGASYLLGGPEAPWHEGGAALVAVSKPFQWGIHWGKDLNTAVANGVEIKENLAKIEQLYFATYVEGVVVFGIRLKLKIDVYGQSLAEGSTMDLTVSFNDDGTDPRRQSKRQS